MLALIVVRACRHRYYNFHVFADSAAVLILHAALLHVMGALPVMTDTRRVLPAMAGGVRTEAASGRSRLGDNQHHGSAGKGSRNRESVEGDGRHVISGGARLTMDSATIA